MQGRVQLMIFNSIFVSVFNLLFYILEASEVFLDNKSKTVAYTKLSQTWIFCPSVQKNNIPVHQSHDQIPEWNYESRTIQPVVVECTTLNINARNIVFI